VLRDKKKKKKKNHSNLKVGILLHSNLRTKTFHVFVSLRLDIIASSVIFEMFITHRMRDYFSVTKLALLTK
jgi:hypothetical protein